MPIRLDDGSLGTRRVETRPCGAGEDCGPYDCGCPVEHDSYWIEITGADGRVVSRMHLWAAYGAFQVVPVDIVDGPRPIALRTAFASRACCAIPDDYVGMITAMRRERLLAFDPSDEQYVLR